MRHLSILLPLLLVTVSISGCAFGVGAGVGLTADTRGAVGVMASFHVMPWGMRVKDDGDGIEGSGHLESGGASGGVTFDGDGVLAVDIPLVGMTVDSLSRDMGFLATLNPRFQFTYGDETTTAMGGSVNAAFLPYLRKEKLHRLESRPEWPDGWKLHRLGPHVQVAAMTDDAGWYGHFYLGALYSYMAYFTIGL